jgi:hypothetical protein
MVLANAALKKDHHAAPAVFWQKESEGASFEDLTKAVGVGRSGLYLDLN